MKALVDGDLIVYAVAGSCEGNQWSYKGSIYTSKTELNEVLKQDGVTDAGIEKCKVPETWESCRKSVMSYLESILDFLDMDYKIYLSGSGNFRYTTATIQPYKGNRSSIERPFHYDNVRQFLVEAYSATVSSGIEADDAIGLDHDPDSTIITTTDKDLNCIPGMHYNWVQKKCYWVTEAEANRSFYSQVLTGDPTDNILGLYGVGPKSACVKALSLSGSERDMFNIVAGEYKCRFGSYWRQFMSENCELLWILQQRKPMWREYIEKED